ncbi:MAG: carboxypeptidase regulatory-like domain-containing protein, partial [Candidatus Hydrogenedentes bacterium]|nr:carboxypeptidase regulatory-like domain-containing protein [Candidatus Hydrogenedentota bacterium]
LPWILQSLVISLYALVLARVLRRKGPAVENVVLRFGLVALWLAPAATILFSYLHIDGVSVALPQSAPVLSLSSPKTAEQPSPTVPPQPIPQVLAIPQAQPVNAPISATPFDPLATAYAAIVCLWILGATFLLLRLAALYATLLHVRWNAAHAPAPLCDLLDKHSAAMRVRAPRLRAHHRVNGPCVTGLLRSTILLPPNFAASDPRMIESVLLHELSHAKRRDCAWNLLAYITASIFWFQPMLWRIRRRLDETSDLIADDCVIHHRREPVEYARHLANLAEACIPTRAESLATAGITPTKSDLIKRVRRILDANRLIQLRTSRKLVFAIALTAALITTATGIIGAESGEIFPVDPIQGTVFSVKGDPIAGATVELIERFQTKPGEDTPEPHTITKTSSNEDGSFSITAQRAKTRERSKELRIAAQGFVPQVISMSYDTQHPQRFFLDYYGRPAANADAVLYPARSLNGTVKDLQGRPIMGATVQTSDTLSEAKTDAEGNFTLDGVPDYASRLESSEYRVTASHPDFVSADATAAANATHVIVTLDPGVVIEGIVRDRETAEALAGILVYGQSTGKRETVRTDAAGKYHLRTKAGKIVLSIPSHRFGDPKTIGCIGTVAETPVFVAEGEIKTGVDLQVTRGKLLHGRVVDAASKQPVPEMHIRVRSETERERRPIGRPVGETDEQGQFTVSGLAPGNYTFFGFDSTVAALITDEVTVDITSDSLPDPIQLTAKSLPPNAGGMLTGTLVYPDGKPAHLAQVFVYVDNPIGERESERCRTSPDGTFGFEMAVAFLEMQGPGEFRATDNTGKYVALLELADVSKPPQPFVLTLQKGATFSGTVRDDKGQSMPGINVVMNRDIPIGPGSLTLQQGLNSGTTDAEGKYVTTAYIASSRDKNVELECMPMPSNDRKYRFSYMPEGKYTNLNATPGAHTDGLDFVLKVDGNEAHFVAVAKEKNP